MCVTLRVTLSLTCPRKSSCPRPPGEKQIQYCDVIAITQHATKATLLSLHREEGGSLRNCGLFEDLSCEDEVQATGRGHWLKVAMFPVFLSRSRKPWYSSPVPSDYS